METNKLNVVLDLCKSVDESFRVTTLQIFLSIADNEYLGNDPLMITDFTKLHHLTLASASRHCMLLSETRRQGDDGMGLIQITTNPLSRNAKQLNLTTKGKRLYDSIRAVLT